jgi:glutamine synthetase
MNPLRILTDRTERSSNGKSGTGVSKMFGENVFNLKAMREYLTEEALEAVLRARKNKTRIDAAAAQIIAKGLKQWALNKGATHYSHWFQPLTGMTAEKHDAFFKPNRWDASGVETLSAQDLIQREADASSFPSGGRRSTHRARGYTIWDPSSPPFILDVNQVKTLYIPAIFISYTGEALDYKTPLLRSIEAVGKAATEVCRLFDPQVQDVYATLGWEQEYFVIARQYYEARPDLMMAKRTLFGAKPAKHQEKADHYFASIPESVQEFIYEFEESCFKLGIPLQTRHNEVAPAQYEVAPMFEELNVAVDHNLLLMDVMNRISTRHKLQVLFHEKPFAGINGSGKHNNWSLSTDTGENLLSPGENPSENLRFLTFFINVLAALNRYEALLRASVASAGNDHRLGANEAPPAIISADIGDSLLAVLEGFMENRPPSPLPGVHSDSLIRLARIPAPTVDNTDRNRTSPFPFTGNKFEFRAVGANFNCSFPMTTLNTMLAEQLTIFGQKVREKINHGIEKSAAIRSALVEEAQAAMRIVFNGDGYSDAWKKEAEKRGLSHIPKTPDALKELISPKAVELFEKHGVLTEGELRARYNVFLDYYCKDLETEALLYLEMTRTYILPPALRYMKELAEVCQGYKELNLDAETPQKIAAKIDKLVRELWAATKELKKILHELEGNEDNEYRATVFSQNATSIFAAIRSAADELELLVPDDMWILPKYREMLLIR